MDHGKKNKKKVQPLEVEQGYLAKGDSLNDLLNDLHEHPSASQEVRVKVTQKRHERYHDGPEVVEYEENLGENYDQTPWVPPSIEKAKEYKEHSIYRGGTARIDSIDIVRVSDLGAGVTLYFQFALSMAICLFVMTLFTIPSLVFAFYGDNVLADDRDSFGFYRLTLGNVGYSASTVKYMGKCGYLAHKTDPSLSVSNASCIIVNDSYEIPTTQAGGLLTAMEFLQIAVFAIGVFHVYRTALSVTGRNAKSETQVSDFSIMVTNLPADITDVEVLDHFSSLYR